MFTSVYYMKSLASLLLATTLVAGYGSYRDLIPNGKNVPHPCRANYLWQGVGHQNQEGGGDRNPFGLDFASNGKVWDECLCEADSDGDGRTNGEELGDPDCVWQPGDVPHTDKGLSHPGVCEPIDSELCQKLNEWEVDCSSPDFVCDELDKDDDVANITIRMAPTSVPAKETTYICQGLDLPTDGSYHIIASEPFVYNENVVHHITAYSCPDVAIEEARRKYSEPVECDMAPFPCPQIMTIWALGIPGTCLAPEYGLRMGMQGTKYVVLQMHWNNPLKKDDYVDSSGMILHYTPNLRPYDGAVITVGPTSLELHPGYNRVSADGTCPSQCTEYMFKENIYIALISPHMHYLGREMIVGQLRDGEVIRTLVNDTQFSYDNPQLYEFNPPIEMKPGDEISVTCTYETKSKSSFTLFGDATADEMCAPIVMYYPIQANATYCSNFDEISYCGVTVGTTEAAQKCLADTLFFFFRDFPVILAQLNTTCDPTGLTCMEGCKELIAQLRANYSCLHEEADGYTKGMVALYDRFDNNFITMFISCDEWPEDKVIQVEDKDDTPSLFCDLKPTSTSSACGMPSILMLMALYWLQKLMQ